MKRGKYTPNASLGIDVRRKEVESRGIRKGVIVEMVHLGETGKVARVDDNYEVFIEGVKKPMNPSQLTVKAV